MTEQFDKSDAYKVLDTVNMWINNCDTKASIMIAAISIVATVFFTTDIFDIVSSVVINSSKLLSGWMIIYNIILWLSVICLIVGVIFLIRVIISKVITTFKSSNNEGKLETKTYPSFMFFGLIANKGLYNDFNAYCSKVQSVSNEEIIEDLCYQIYNASSICNKKFKNFKKGLFLVLGGLLAFVLQVIIYYCFNIESFVLV